MVEFEPTVELATTLPDMILATKLYVPQPQPNLVARPYLLARLNTTLQRLPGVIVLSAPPGFGKTTLLSEWLADLRFTISDFGLKDDEIPKGYVVENRKSQIQNRVAWLSLDADDNNTRRFLAYCVAALQSIQPGLGESALTTLRATPTGYVPPGMLITPLINQMMAITEPFIFVFDDYHLITNPILHNGLAFLLENLPPHLTLVITSRTELPVSLARLRGQGQLTELGAADLRFTATEAATFLNRVMDCRLSPAQVDILEARTEGWIAGLQMAAISMRGVKDTAAFVQSFSGTHRHILDYLLEEVLNRQPDPIQHFLLQTSILNRLTGPLCDAVIDNSKSKIQNPKSKIASGQQMLNRLEQANLFIVPLDDERRWYRYHHLFADLLRHRLEQVEGAAGVAKLHNRASQWYEENGFVAEAMSHALAAMDVARIVRLAKEKAATMLSRSELVTLLSWLDILPQALAHSRPRFALLQAWAMVLTGQLQAVETHLQEAELEFNAGPQLEQADIFGETTTLRAAVAYFQRDMETAIELYRRALRHTPPDNLFLRGIVMQCLGAAHSWLGNVVEATRAFTEASVISQSTGNLQVALIALWNLAQLQVEQGYLHQADKIYREALQLVDRQPAPQQTQLLPHTGRIYIGLAEVMVEWDRLNEAEEQANKGLVLAEEGHESGTLSGGYLILARIKQAQGDLSAAAEYVQTAQHYANRYTGPRYLAAQCATYRAWLWLRQGNLRAVNSWLQEQHLQLDPLPAPIPYLREGEYLIQARLLLALAQQPNGEADITPETALLEAINILNCLAKAAQNSQRAGTLIEVIILQALLFQAQGNLDKSLAALKAALSIAEPEGYIRCFVDEGAAIAGLLRQAANQKIAPNYVSRLLTAFEQSPHLPGPQSPLLLDPLSEREIEILHLIAGGMSNKELAQELIVTVGTVKWHLNNIYGKLGVKSRTQAVARARELGLL
jgi:LuxR family maltose regulon positive regulatory protein